MASHFSSGCQWCFLCHSAPSAEFTIPAIPDLAADTPISRRVSSATQDTSYTYAWSSPNPGVTFAPADSHTTDFTIAGPALPTPGASTAYGITLTIRENGNVAATHTQSVTVRRLSEVTQIVYKDSLGNEMVSASLAHKGPERRGPCLHHPHLLARLLLLD